MTHMIWSLLKGGLNYYNALIDGLIDAGIVPMVTLYHWDLPSAVYDRVTCTQSIVRPNQPDESVQTAGWTCPGIVDEFAHYARFVWRPNSFKNLKSSDDLSPSRSTSRPAEPCQ